MWGLTWGLTWGLEKYNSLIIRCLNENTGGLGKNKNIHGFSPSYDWKDQIAFGKKIDTDRHLFAHKVHDEKPTMVRLDVQTWCLWRMILGKIF